MGCAQIKDYFHQSGSLRENYRVIGESLLQYEERCNGIRSVFDFSAFGVSLPVPKDLQAFFTKSIQEFRVSVSFLSVQALEAYFEDLLDLDIAEDRLHIETSSRAWKSVLIALLGLCFSVAVGLFAVSIGATFSISFILTVLLALPFAALWHYAPRNKIARRMRFARLLSGEISRRRGDGGPFAVTRLFLDSFGRAEPLV